MKVITKRADGTTRVVSQPKGKTRTQRQFKEECDVNNIVRKFKKTGSITHLRNANQGVYADLTTLPSLQEAHATVNAANEAFLSVPAEIRQRFGHDPQQFIAFLSDPKNNEEAVKLGLKTKKTTPAPDPILTELQTLNKNLNKKSEKITKPKTES